MKQLTRGLFLSKSCVVCWIGAGWLTACSLDDAPPKPPAPSGAAASVTSTDRGSDAVAAAPASGSDSQANNLVAEKKFASSVEQPTSLNWLGKYHYVDTEVTMAHARSGQSAYFKQNQRDTMYDLFIQGANGSSLTTHFALSRPNVDPSDIRVTINGVAVAPQNFTFDAINCIVTFNQPPPLGAKIYVYYWLKGGLLTSFSVGTSIDPSSIAVTVNQVVTRAFKYDAASGNLIFDAPPPDSAVINVNYTRIGDALLSYPVQVPDEGLPNLTAFTKDDPSRVFVVTYANGQVTFKSQDFTDGLVTVVRYFKDNEAQTLTLPNPPLKDTLVLKLDATKCTNDQFTVTDTAITTNCELSESAPVVVTYSYVSVYNQTFSMADAMPKEAGNYVWRVWVGGTERTDFTRQENVVSFATQLLIQQEVIVRIYRAP